MTAPAPPKASSSAKATEDKPQGQGELKRALVECLAKAMFAVSHEEPWEQAEELTRRIYLEEATAGVDAVCLKLAEGSPEVIEAMAEVWVDQDDEVMDWKNTSPHWREIYKGRASAALAAGMKVIAEGGK